MAECIIAYGGTSCAFWACTVAYETFDVPSLSAADKQAVARSIATNQGWALVSDTDSSATSAAQPDTTAEKDDRYLLISFSDVDTDNDGYPNYRVRLTVAERQKDLYVGSFAG